MVVLRIVRKYQVVIGTCSDNFSEPTNDFFNSYKSYATVIFYIKLIIDSIAYVYYHFSHLATSSNAMMVMCGGLVGFGCYVGVGCNMKRLKILYNTLEEIVDDGKKLCRYSE